MAINPNKLKIQPEAIFKITTLFAAGASLVMSIALYFSGDTTADKLNGIYVGVWVPSILALGAFLLAGKRKGN